MFKNRRMVSLWRIAIMVIGLLLITFSALQAAQFSLISEGDAPTAPLYNLDIEKSILQSASRLRKIDLLPQISTPDGVAIGDEIILNLFSDVLYTATIDRVSVNIYNTITIRGRLQDYPLGYILITTTGERSLVSICVPELGSEYLIISEPVTVNHYLIEVDPSKMDSIEGAPVLLPPPTNEEDQNEIKLFQRDMSMQGVDDPATIDVMVAYTPAARSYADSSEGGMENVIAQAMGLAQLSLDNSITQVTIQLVNASEVSYTESGDSVTDLERFTYTDDGYMDDVHTLRNTYGADLVSLFALVDDVGGLGWLLNTTSGLPDYGFYLVRVQQVSWTYTYIHEMGHNMGCHHHKEQLFQAGPGLFSYSAGWRWVGSDSGRYCDLMTYEDGSYFEDGQTHTRVGCFSNPDINYESVATGHPVDGDNARTVREVKHTIAAYRDSATITPILSITPESLDFGTVDTIMTFSITNTGEGTLNWSIGTVDYTQGSDWISEILPLSDTTTTETDVVAVTVDRTELTSGRYNAVIHVISADGGDVDVNVAIGKKSPPDKPTNISPADGAVNVSRTPVLTASEYKDPDDDPMLVARWRIKKDGEIVWNSNNVSNSIEVTAGTILNYSTTYTWQVRYANSYGLESEWSDETSFTTRAKPQTNPSSPTNISPANLATGISLNPILSASGFSDPDGDSMNDSHWRIRGETEAYEITSVWESSGAGATTSIVVTTALAPNTRYFWQVRYQDTDGLWSAWSTETMFTTFTDEEEDGDDDGEEGDRVEGGSSGGGCFIATAAYGTPMAAEVVKLRNFRDNYLLKNRAGQAFVRWYYRHSPPVAEYIRQRKIARMLVRAGLRPLLWILSF